LKEVNAFHSTTTNIEIFKPQSSGFLPSTLHGSQQVAFIYALCHIASSASTRPSVSTLFSPCLPITSTITLGARDAG
jgi:hypothetical protein